jgi:hypothetical protein
MSVGEISDSLLAKIDDLIVQDNTEEEDNGESVSSLSLSFSISDQETKWV